MSLARFRNHAARPHVACFPQSGLMSDIVRGRRWAKLGSRGFAPWVCFALAGGRERRLGEAQRRGRPPSSAASSTRCHCRSHTSEACSSVFIADWIGCRLLRRGWRGEASFGQIDCAKLKRAKNLLGWQYVASQCFRHDTNIYTGLSCEPSLASCSLNFRTEQS